MGLELVPQIGFSFLAFFIFAAALGTAAALGWI
jgi:hypothetical protein